jgi:NAD kinase
VHRGHADLATHDGDAAPGSPRSREELVLTADGQEVYPFSPGAKVRVQKGPVRVCLVRFEGQTFFDTLKRALNWAG